jgi:hypothetical protein
MLNETKRQVINLYNSCIWLVNLFELYDDLPTSNFNNLHETLCCTEIRYTYTYYTGKYLYVVYATLNIFYL